MALSKLAESFDLATGKIIMKSDIFPFLQSSKNFSIIEVYIDELYLWKEIQKIATLYPTAQFHDILPFKYWYEVEVRTPTTAYPYFSKARGENVVRLNDSSAFNHTLGTNSQPILDLIDKNERFIHLCPSHFLTGFRWRKLQNESKKTKLLVIDAHDDRGGSIIDSLWLQPDFLSQTGFIGGWGMACTNGKDWFSREEPGLTANYGAFAKTIGDSIQSDFGGFFHDSQVLISIDLDYFDHGPYLSSYWLKNLFLTHSLSVRQKIELFRTEGRLKEKEEFSVAEIALGDNLLRTHTNKIKRKEIFDSIFSNFCVDMKRILDCLLKEDITIVGIDLCEYSPILDRNAETFQLIVMMADFLHSYLENEFLNR